MFACRLILILLSFVVSLQCAPVPRPQTALTTANNTLEFTFFPATEAQTATPTTQSRLPTTTTQVSLITGLVTTSTALNTSPPPTPISTFIQYPETTGTTISPPAPETTSTTISPPVALKASPGTPLVTFGELSIPSQGGTFDDFMVSGTTEPEAESKPKNRHPNKKTSKTKARRFFPSIFDSEYSPDRFDVPSGLSKIPPPFISGERPALGDTFQNTPFSPNGAPSGGLEGNENGQSVEGNSQQDLPVVPSDSNAPDGSSLTQAFDDASAEDDASKEDDTSIKDD